MTLFLYLKRRYRQAYTLDLKPETQRPMPAPVVLMVWKTNYLSLQIFILAYDRHALSITPPPKH